MPRIPALILLCALALAGQQKPAEQEPPEEDVTLTAKKTYVFNPLQAEKELRIGNFYYKKGNWKGAAARFRESTRWNPGLAEAYFRLGEASEKLNDAKAAHEAYAKFLELAPKDRRAPDVKKKLPGTG